MALRDALRALIGANPQYRDVTFVGPGMNDVLGLSVEDLWRTQPHLRTVVSFVARNIAQLGLHTFERVSETDRRRLRDDPVAMTLGRPNPSMTMFELVYGLVSDLKLYDVAMWLLERSADAPSGWRIWPISPGWVTSTGGGSAWEPEWVEVQRPGALRPSRILTADMVMFHGWNPGNPAGWSSPVEALRGILAEQIHANAYRQQVWQRGGRVGTVLVRPADAPSWSPDARERFARDWRAKWTGNDGPKAGGTPILEDGMDLKRIGFSAKEDEWVDGAKLSLSTVASVYHINPTMVGVLDNANFSNVREFRRMLYGDSLGPDLAMIEDRVNAFLVPRLTSRSGVYVEFNIAEKMQGSFEEQASAMQTAVGAPWMTRAEARGRFNLPEIDDADGLVVPLNVLTGGQASPTDSGSQNLASGSRRPVKASGPVRVKARAPQGYEAKTAEALGKFFRRQRAVVLTALGAKADGDWWDAERWDAELSDDLYALAVATAKQVAGDVLDAIGFGPDAYDEARTLAFLRAVADSRAAMINQATRDQIDAALSAGGSAADVFDTAESQRVAAASAALVTTFSAFATTEAAKQVAGDKATKTWIVTSTNPRASHASMNGETVGIEESFSNGMNWPGDPVGGADEVAGCLCDVAIDIS